jgi:hypothetical protein
MKTNLDYSKLLELIDRTKDNNNQLEVNHYGKIWTSSFIWSKPAELEKVRVIERELGFLLPADYVWFLTNISNGATLYRDIKYGQWGYVIYGVDEILDMQENWRDVFAEDWEEFFLAIGKIIGESHVLIQMLNKPSKSSDGFELRDANPIDTMEDWEIVSPSFHGWINNLVAKQGVKYWLSK